MPQQETRAEAVGICGLREGNRGRRSVRWPLRDVRGPARGRSVLYARSGLARFRYVGQPVKTNRIASLETDYFPHRLRVRRSLTFITLIRNRGYLVADLDSRTIHKPDGSPP